MHLFCARVCGGRVAVPGVLSPHCDQSVFCGISADLKLVKH